MIIAPKQGRRRVRKPTLLVGASLALLAVAGLTLWQVLPARADYIQQGNLIGYWPLDEASGATAADVSGYGNDATYDPTLVHTNDAPSQTPFNTHSLQFNGSNSAVLSSGSADDMTTGSFTMSAWVKTTYTDDYQYIMSKRIGNSGYEMGVTAGGGLSLYLNDGSGASAEHENNSHSLGGTDLQDGSWHNIAVTINRTAHSADFYIDGQLVGTDDMSSYTLGSLSNGGALTLGKESDPDLASQGLHGSMSDARLYSRVLSATEVGELASDGNTTATWTGASSANNNFNTPDNWDINAVPDAYTNIFIPNTSACDDSESGCAHLTANTGMANLTLGSDGTSLGQFYLGNYDLTLNDNGKFSNDGRLYLDGSQTLTNFTNDSDSGGVYYTGNASYSSLAAGYNYYSLYFLNQNSTWNITDPLTINGNFQINSPQINFGSASVDVGGNFYIHGGNINGGSADISVGGNWIVDNGTKGMGSFTPGTSSVTLDGVDQSISGSNTFYNLSKTVTTNTNLFFQAGSTTTVNHHLTLLGPTDDSGWLALTSSSVGTAWKLNLPGSYNFDHIYVQDSDNITTGDNSLLSAPNSVDGDRNTGWDLDAPTVTSLDPADGSWSNDSTPTLTFTTADVDSTQVKYEVQIDNNSDFSSPEVDTTSSLATPGADSFTPGSDLSGDSYYWRVRAIDEGNLESGWSVANSGGVAFKVDVAGPSTPTASPSGGYYQSLPTVSLTSSDSGSGVAAIYYTTDGGMPNDSDQEYTDPITVTDGETIRAVAYDNAGNTSSPSSDTYHLDDTAPDAPSFDPDGGTFASLQDVTITTTDNTGGSGVAAIYYTTDGTTPSKTNGTKYSDKVSISRDTTLKAIAYDNAGNVSSVTSKHYKIGAAVSGTVTSDGTTGLAGRTVRVLINGSDAGSTTTDSSGNYSVSGLSYSSGDVITAYLDNDDVQGVSFYKTSSSDTDISSLSIRQNYLEMHGTGIELSDIVAGSNSDTDITGFYTMKGSTEYHIDKAGATLQIATDATIKIIYDSLWLDNGTNLDVSGELTLNNANVFFTGDSGAGSGNHDQHFAQTGIINTEPIAVGSVQTIYFANSGGKVILDTDINAAGPIDLEIIKDDDSDLTSTLECNGHDLAGGYLNVDAGGVYSCSGAGDVTLTGIAGFNYTYGLFIMNGGQFNGGSGDMTTPSVDIGDDSGLRAPSGTLTVTEDFYSDGGSFDANGGTVVFAGTDESFAYKDEFATSDLTFHNLTVSDPSGASSISFGGYHAVNVTGALTMTGNSSHKLSVDGNGGTINFSGSGSSLGTLDNLSVKDSKLTVDADSPVLLPADPTGSADGGGNTGWFDDAPDTPTNLAPADGNVTTDATPTLTFNATDPNTKDSVKYEIQIDNNSDFKSPEVDYTSGLNPQGAQSYTVASTLDNGGYYWRVKTIDEPGESSGWVAANGGKIAFKIDANAPATPTITNYKDGSWGADNTPTLTFTTSDADSGDQLTYEVQIFKTSDLSNPIVDYVSPPTAPGNMSYTLPDSNPLPDGSYYWRVRASDGMLTSSYAVANATTAFKVDTAAPTTPGKPTSPTPTNDSTPTISWDASTDNGSGLADPTYTLEYSTKSDFSSDTTTTTTNSTYWTPSSALTDNTWYFRVKATDALGHDSAWSPTETVVVDTTPPTKQTVLTLPTSPYNDSTPTISWDASTDSGSGLANPAYRLEWSTSSTFASVTGSDSVNGTSDDPYLPDGSYYFRVVATDKAGNISTSDISSQVTVIDTTPPSVKTTTPANGTTDAPKDTTLTMNFSEPVKLLTGNFTIYKASDDSVVEAIAANGGEVSGSGGRTLTIDPSSDLAYDTNYYVKVDAGALSDIANNDFAGVNDKTTWAFKTVMSPMQIAIIKIKNYASDPTNNPAPTPADYQNAGVSGVNEGNIDAVNDKIASTDPGKLGDSGGISKVTDPVVATEKIKDYAKSGGKSAPPTVQDYKDAGIDGVTGDNLDEVNKSVADSGSTSTGKIQKAADKGEAVSKIQQYAKDPAGSPAPTVDDYKDAGITGVNSGNISEVNQAVAASGKVGSASEIQVIATRATAPAEKSLNSGSRQSSDAAQAGDTQADSEKSDSKKTNSNENEDTIQLNNAKQNNSNDNQNNNKSKNTGAFLGLGWWWLLVIVVIVFVWWLIARSRANKSGDSA